MEGKVYAMIEVMKWSTAIILHPGSSVTLARHSRISWMIATDKQTRIRNAEDPKHIKQ